MFAVSAGASSAREAADIAVLNMDGAKPATVRLLQSAHLLGLLSAMLSISVVRSR